MILYSLLWRPLCILKRLRFISVPLPTKVNPLKLPIPCDILFITLCGVIAGAEGWSEIFDYAEGHHDGFKQQGFLIDGVPVDDTIACIIAKIEPEQFRQCLLIG